MHAQLLALGLLVVGQSSPATQFAPNVGAARPQRVAESDEPTAGSPLLAPAEEVELEPAAESTQGVEFTPGGPGRGFGNGLRGADGSRPTPPTRFSATIEASSDEELVRTSAGEQRSLAWQLLRQGQTPLDNADRILGKPLSLAAAVESVTDRGQRAATIRAYWTLSTKLAAAHWAAELANFLANLRDAPGGADRVGIEAARLDALAQWQAARNAVIDAQHQLAELSRLAVASDGHDLPLPQDLPLVTPYHTKFDRLFANRTPPNGARRLAATIPLDFELLETRAAAVAAGREAVQQIRHAYQQGTTDLSQMLATQDRVNRTQRDFLDCVAHYNESISTYALAVAGSTDTATLVSMLIPAPTAGLRIHVPAQGTIAGAAAGDDAPPRTARGGSVNRDVRAASQVTPVSPDGDANWSSAPRQPPSRFRSP